MQRLRGAGESQPPRFGYFCAKSNITSIYGCYQKNAKTNTFNKTIVQRFLDKLGMTRADNIRPYALGIKYKTLRDGKPVPYVIIYSNLFYKFKFFYCFSSQAAHTTSSQARPCDSNIVISSSLVLVTTLPLTTSPRSPNRWLSFITPSLSGNR